MKKTVVFILLVCLTLFMAACGSTEEPTEGQNEAVSVQYAVGDIVLADGSIVKAMDLTDINNSNVPIAVIAGFQEDGAAFGIGVHRSDVPLQWASDHSAGYAANFTNIVCTQDSEFDFSGDKDGSDNWNEICTQDQGDTTNAEVNYPAFHFANTYAAGFGLSGDFAVGWYMPSIEELCDIYQNREPVNNSLRHIYELDEEASMNGLETNWYWSSSQAGAENDYAWFVHFFNGYAGECPKNFTNVHALVIRAF